MSTLKVAAINNPSASSGGLAISASGLVTGAGLDLIVTQSFSAASSVSLNNCFSADYDNYAVLLTLTGSTSAATTLRMRASGTDAATNYNWQVLNVNGTSVGAAAVASQTSYAIADTGTGKTTADVLIFDPFAAAATNLHLRANARTLNTLYMNIGQHTTATSYDGLSVIASSGTITGSVSVYGYRK